MQFAQIRDRVTNESQSADSRDFSGLIGDWVNSNPDTTGVARMTIAQSGENLTLQVYAIGPDGLIDWGSVNIDLFAPAPSSTAVTGFTCVYDFGFAEVTLQAMILKGLIVLAQIHRFKDDSQRVDYFVREYFGLEHGRY
jgi:hypothetical protein